MFTLERQTYIKCLFYANQTPTNPAQDVKEMKYFVYSHTQTCI